MDLLGEEIEIFLCFIGDVSVIIRITPRVLLVPFFIPLSSNTIPFFNKFIVRLLSS